MFQYTLCHRHRDSYGPSSNLNVQCADDHDMRFGLSADHGGPFFSFGQDDDEVVKFHGRISPAENIQFPHDCHGFLRLTEVVLKWLET